MSDDKDAADAWMALWLYIYTALYKATIGMIMLVYVYAYKKGLGEA